MKQVGGRVTVAIKEVASLISAVLRSLLGWIDFRPGWGGGADLMAIRDMPANPQKTPHHNI